jgi:hypothetical protein
MATETRVDVVDALRSVVKAYEFELVTPKSVILTTVQPALLMWALETIVAQRVEIASLRCDRELVMTLIENFAR